MSFRELLRAAGRRHDSWLCVGLDTDPALLPEGVTALAFNRAIVAATADLVAAYKLNLGFYLAAGPAGIQTLQETVAAVPADLPVILDLKCGDIQNTAEHYARAAFETFGCHAVTVNPLMGHDAVLPFLRYQDRGVFVLCLTSNPGAADFLRQPLADGQALYRQIAGRVREWSAQGDCGLVVAPVDAASVEALRAELPHTPFLVPGVGAQGLDLEVAVRYGCDFNRELALINVGRPILYASRDRDFATAARAAAQRFRKKINRYR